MVPCVIFEDDHLLVVHKPPGLNTHSPAPFAGEGLFDWLRHREPRWATLAIIHRLDKETSGVMVFARSPAANRSLTGQFSRREVQKKYLLATDRPIRSNPGVVASRIARAGERYRSCGYDAGGEPAETLFRLIAESEFPALHEQLARMAPQRRLTLVEAEPRTGRTHQVRVHAADLGLPILGDTLYGGTPGPRLCLHAAEIRFRHPASNEPLTFSAPADFLSDPRLALRQAVIAPSETNAFRLLHAAADGTPGFFADLLGPALLTQSAEAPSPGLVEMAKTMAGRFSFLADKQAPGNTQSSTIAPSPHGLGHYHKTLSRQVRQQAREKFIGRWEDDRLDCDNSHPSLHRQDIGGVVPEPFTILENGLRFELSFSEGYSTGLFLDQRDNRRRVLTGHVAAGFPALYAGGSSPHESLNVFAYTCGFSVCAARAGSRVTSLDLSRKYLDWGRRNFELNGLDPAANDFIFGDAFQWLRRLAKKDRRYRFILLDPPTFSASKEGGVFQVERDYGRLVSAALPLLAREGVLFASTNAAGWAPEKFLDSVRDAIAAAGRRVLNEQYFPQPPDFPVTREEPAYLKTLWLRIR